MTAKDLFGVGVRWIGIVCALSAIPMFLSLNYSAFLMGIGQVALGLLLITRADLVTDLSYPRGSKDERRDE